MPTNYQVEIDNSNHYRILPTSSIYDYRNENFHELYERFYNFCRGSLDFHVENIDIDPNIFLFYNSLNINAKAGYNDEVFVILFYDGLFKWAITNILNNDLIDNYLSEHYNEIASKYDNTLNLLSFQVATQFTFYHETAHLIQKSKRKLSFELQERSVDEQNYIYLNHLLELNADGYASIAIATHITQYLENIFNENITLEDFKFTVKFFGASLFYYLLSFSDSNEPLYYYEKSHPHPVIRLFNILIRIINHLTNSEYLFENNMEFNQFELLQEVFSFYYELEEENVFSTNVGEIINYALESREEMVEYLSAFLDFNDDNHFDALEKWNQHIV